jgi:hypothetical protein
MAADEDDCFERLQLARELLGNSQVLHGYVSSNTEYSRYQDAFGDEDDTEGETGLGITSPVTEAYFGTTAQREVTGYEGPDIPARTFYHPGGGSAGFLSGAINPGMPAAELFTEGLTSIFDTPNGTTTAVNVLIDVCEQLESDIEADAPIEFGDLKGCWSGKVWGE